MKRHDHDALELAIKRARASNKRTREQIYYMLAHRPWIDVARFASCHCQYDALRLAPWQYAPCELPDDYDPAIDNDPDLGRREAAQLLRQMLDLGISRWHPNPLEAIEQAKKRKGALDETT